MKYRATTFMRSSSLGGNVRQKAAVSRSRSLIRDYGRALSLGTRSNERDLKHAGHHAQQEGQARQYAQAQVGFSSRRRNRTGEGPHLNEGGQHVVARDVTVRSSAKYAFDPDNSSILVAGESGVGVQVTRKLKDMGAWVWMMQSTDEKRAEVEKMMAILVNGDPAVPTDVTRVMSEIDDLDLVVASGDSMGNLLEAAQDAGVKRFVLVTEKAVESSDSDMELIVVEPTGEDVATLAVDALFST
mmetsp:Transcript_957/g.1725  ORF Transcript_957/g.1725 Transcript_957/m.1725 type:complete len:243 (+) Transcript_957:63-791(+)